MKTIYLIQLQTRNSKEQPTQPVAVPRENLIKFINENLREEVVMLISAVECYEQMIEVNVLNIVAVCLSSFAFGFAICNYIYARYEYKRRTDEEK